MLAVVTGAALVVNDKYRVRCGLCYLRLVLGFVCKMYSLVDWDNCFFNDTATTEIYTLSLHDALPI